MIGLSVLTLATLGACAPAVRNLPNAHTMPSLVHFNENSALQIAAQAAGVDVPVDTWISDADRSEVASMCTSIFTGKPSPCTISTVIDNSVGGSLLAQQALNAVSTTTPMRSDGTVATTTTPAADAPNNSDKTTTATTTAITYFSLVTSGANIESSCN
eukprot:TRINITY_DN13670_c0_g1_i1.p2 TRINITY_DN13670_c0_g1~~TRINITY_DN13670_c0_g1_i1.p2  ORF type:complete len:158 (-),score=35.70 TRINITY_DN13670_c0_g1_i1:163-636(-)